MLIITIIRDIPLFISTLISSVPFIVFRIKWVPLVTVDAFSRFRGLSSMCVIIIQRRIWCYPCVAVDLLQLHVLVADK